MAESLFKVEQLAVTLARLESLVAGLYLPNPERGVLERALKPFRYDPQGRVAAVYDSLATADVRGRMLWASPALQTSGYTLHDGYVRIDVIEDTVPAGLGLHDLFTAALEGSCGSTWVEMDVATVQSTGLPGTFVFPLLSRESLALSTRLVFYLADNAGYTEQHPWVQNREVRFTVDGVLVSGPTF